MPRNTFTNPANGDTYEWPVNHSDEDATGKTRQITRSANTGSVGAVRQQGDDGATVLTFNGVINTRAQLQQFWAWYALSRTQTIYLTDYDGQEYEVQITAFQPKRVRKLTSIARDPGMPHHYYTYTITMEVLRFIAGDMASAGVTP